MLQGGSNAIEWPRESAVSLLIQCVQRNQATFQILNSTVGFQNAKRGDWNLAPKKLKNPFKNQFKLRNFPLKKMFAF